MRKVSTEARRRALVARHHLHRPDNDLHAVVADLVAVHSSDPLTPHLGLWARVGGYTTEPLERAMPATLWRLHAMRRTLWVAPTASVGWLDASVGQAVLRKEWRRLLGWVAADRDDGEAWLARLSDEVVAAVAAQPGVHTRQLTEQLPELSTKITVGSGKWTSQVPVGSRLLFCLAMELRLARRATQGSWKASQYGWCVAPAVDRPAAEPARAWLIERYLARFAPVTTTDIRWWTGLTAAQVRKALASLAAEAVGIARGLAWEDPRNVDWSRGLASALTAQGRVLLDLGEDASEPLSEALALRQALLETSADRAHAERRLEAVRALLERTKAS